MIKTDLIVGIPGVVLIGLLVLGTIGWAFLIAREVCECGHQKKDHAWNTTSGWNCWKVLNNTAYCNCKEYRAR